MKLIPMLFSTPMVQAILEGRKTQTRRIVKPGKGIQSEWLTSDLIASVPHGEIINGGWQMHHSRAGTTFAGVDVAYDSPLGYIKCPYGKLGDVIWVREAFSYDYAFHGTHDDENKFYFYKADWVGKDVLVSGEKWKPSIHMPYAACRIWLKITGIGVERLQDITEADAVAEGIKSFRPVPGDGPSETQYYHYLKDKWGPSSVHSFQTLWQSINGAESWTINPWVWKITFERTEKQANK